jgi:hypothetical protein
MKCCINNYVRLRSCIWDINKDFWCRYRGGSQYLLSVFRLHGIILASIISLTNLSTALCLFMVFTGSCMTGFDLLANYHSDLESLIRKSRSRLSSHQDLLDPTSERLLTNFGDHHRHTNPHWWLPGGASTISQLRPVPMSGLVQKRTSEMVALNLNRLSSTWYSKAHSAARPRRMVMLIFNTSWRSTAHSLSEEWLRMWYVFTYFHFQC